MIDKPTAAIKITNDENKRLPPAMKKIRGPPGLRNKSPSEERKMSPEKVFATRQPMKMWASEAKTKPRRCPPGSKYSSPTRTTDESHFSGFVKPAAFMTPQATKESNFTSPSSISEESKRSKPRINGKRAPPGSSNQLASSAVQDLDPNGRWALNFGRQLSKTGKS